MFLLESIETLITLDFMLYLGVHPRDQASGSI